MVDGAVAAVDDVSARATTAGDETSAEACSRSRGRRRGRRGRGLSRRGGRRCCGPDLGRHLGRPGPDLGLDLWSPWLRPWPRPGGSRGRDLGHDLSPLRPQSRARPRPLRHVFNLDFGRCGCDLGADLSRPPLSSPSVAAANRCLGQTNEQPLRTRPRHGSRGRALDGLGRDLHLPNHDLGRGLWPLLPRPWPRPGGSRGLDLGHNFSR